MAISNDYGHIHAFCRQVVALSVVGDLPFGLSASAISRIAVIALPMARELGAVAVAFAGEGCRVAAKVATFALRLPSAEAVRVQDDHICRGYMLCAWIEEGVWASPASRAGTTLHQN